MDDIESDSSMDDLPDEDFGEENNRYIDMLRNGIIPDRPAEVHGPDRNLDPRYRKIVDRRNAREIDRILRDARSADESELNTI